MDYTDQSERMVDFFNLKHDPFGVLVDSMVYSGAGGRYEIVETIRHLLTYSHQDSLVEGPLGSGKRTLAQQVLKLIEDQWRVVWLDATELHSQQDALREIIGQFGLGLKLDADTDAEALLPKILDITTADVEQGSAFLIVVQHGDQLAPEIQSMLLGLRQQVTDIDLRIRQLWLAESLADFPLPLDEDDWYIHTLTPLDDQDASLYLKDRLAAAGSVGALPIPEKDVARLNQLAKGLPAHLNELARDYLISGTFKTTEKQQRFPMTHVIAGLAAICLVVIAFLYQVNEPAPTRVTVPALPTAEGGMSEVEKRLADAVAKVEAKQVSAGDTAAVDLTTADTSAPGKLPDAESATAETPALAPDQTSNASFDPGAAPATPVEPIPVSPPADSVAVAPQPVNRRTLLQTAADEAYTLQLIGVRDRSRLAALVNDFSDPALADIAETTHQEQPWYVLIYGQYPTRAAAQSAVATLPSAFAGTEPWIRTFQSLRADLN